MENITDWSIDQINERIAEIDVEIADIKRLKNEQKLTSEDTEDVSDVYQMHLEWNYALDELRDERNFLSSKL